ncbi:hypothetical protein [Cellulosimicrobium sp. NPDC057127]|uniref:hypothetical protein n=1 Tax=Cellulosimicrobium sp. NPDC057127 TaxID=3346026 RepID=UPI003626A89C
MGQVGAAYAWVHIIAIGLTALVAISIVVYPVCLVRARGNPRKAASMELEFISFHPGWSFLIALTVVAVAWFAWDRFYEPQHTSEGRPYATEWTVHRTSGGGTDTVFPTDTKALGLACNTTLAQDGFVLRSDRGYEEEFEPGSAVCRGRHYAEP